MVKEEPSAVVLLVGFLQTSVCREKARRETTARRISGRYSTVIGGNVNGNVGFGFLEKEGPVASAATALAPAIQELKPVIRDCLPACLPACLRFAAILNCYRAADSRLQMGLHGGLCCVAAAVLE